MEPSTKIVKDIKIESDTIFYEDTGTEGEAMDSTKLLYIGGEDIVAQTMCAKDGTLFLGNIEIKRPTIENCVDVS
jgi:hypothetical protein